MVEFAVCEASIVACYCDSRALDSVVVPVEAITGRVAADELLLIGPAATSDDLVATANAAVGSTAGLVVDQTDGWTIFCLWGDEPERALRQLSHVELPAARPAFVQCPMAHVPGKVIATRDRLFLLVPAPAAHHVARRLRDVCGATTNAERAPLAFAAHAAGAA